MKKRSTKLTILLAVAILIMSSSMAFGFSSYYNSFKSTYPSSPLSLLTGGTGCTVCHNSTSGGSRNSYGNAYANNGYSYPAIESQDSDSDGSNNITEINAGTFPGNSASKPAPTPTACTYTYSAWDICQSNNTQTRTVVSSSPQGCTGTPVVSQACTYVPPAPSACTYTYSAWGTCQTNNTQTRTVVSSSPQGCTGTPVVSQACTYVPPSPSACTYTYSAWGACQSDSTQTRTVVTSSPQGCTGTPVVSQTCNFVPTPPTSQGMPEPTAAQGFFYEPVSLPVVNSDPALAKPMGVGTIADNGNIIDITLLAHFSGYVDISLGLYAASIDPMDIYFLDTTYNFKPLSREMMSLVLKKSESDSDDDDDDEVQTDQSYNKGRRGNLVLWKKHIKDLNEHIGPIQASDFPKGVYALILNAVPSGSDDDGPASYYRWVTYFIVK